MYMLVGQDFRQHVSKSQLRSREWKLMPATPTRGFTHHYQEVYTPLG